MPPKKSKRGPPSWGVGKDKKKRKEKNATPDAAGCGGVTVDEASNKKRKRSESIDGDTAQESKRAKTTNEHRKKEKSKSVGQNLDSYANRKYQPTRQNQLQTEFKPIFAGIDFDKYDNITVQCTGNVLPISDFESSNLHPIVMKNIKKTGYTKPTPVQKYSVPIGLAKKDLMACAQTGSGKTAAYLLPVISTELAECSKRRPFTSTANPFFLILAPTRELACQIHQEAIRFTQGSWMRTVVVYGGTFLSLQMHQLSRGADILVATPGRLCDLIKRGCVVLSSIKYFCLDEADRMLDMGFIQDIRTIVHANNMPRDRVTCMFSATFAPPIRILAKEFLREFIYLEVGRVGTACDSITQVIKYVADNKKQEEILKDLNQLPGRTIVFTETKLDAESLADFLVSQNVSVASIHSNRTQIEREGALRDFKTGAISVLVATDVASRGLDVSDITHVINYELPSNIDSYVHRVGRTGRAGNRGTATAYYNHNNSYFAKHLVNVLKQGNQVIPDFLLEGAHIGGVAPIRGAPKTTNGTGRVSSPYGNHFGESRILRKSTGKHRTRLLSAGGAEGEW